MYDTKYPYFTLLQSLNEIWRSRSLFFSYVYLFSFVNYRTILYGKDSYTDGIITTE